MKSSVAVMLFAALLAVASGCTGRELYQSGLGWRQNECQKILDGTDRARCMETANKDYDSYEKQKAAPAEPR